MTRPTSSSPRSALGRGDLATSLLFVFPLFLAYEVGVMFSTSVNGVDFVTRVVWDAVGRDRMNYLAVHLGLAVVFLGCVLYVRRTRGFTGGLAPMLLESTIYALTLGSFIVFVMHNLLGFDGGLAVSDLRSEVTASLDSLALGTTGQKIVISLGAGVHEELVFRLGLMAGTAAALKGVGARHAIAVASALVASSVLFSAAHHVGPLGDPLEAGVFVYRTLAGAVFGLIFYYRSLAHAVYTHFLYDVYVLLLRS